MTGFEPWTSGVESNHSTNWATNTFLKFSIFVAQVVYVEKNCKGVYTVDLTDDGFKGIFSTNPTRILAQALTLSDVDVVAAVVAVQTGVVNWIWF